MGANGYNFIFYFFILALWICVVTVLYSLILWIFLLSWDRHFTKTCIHRSVTWSCRWVLQHYKSSNVDICDCKGILFVIGFNLIILFPMCFLFYIQGIVPSGFLFPLLQWAGRTHFLLAIVRGIDEVWIFILYFRLLTLNVSRIMYYSDEWRRYKYNNFEHLWHFSVCVC